ncbi:T9SS type A sorting domain-containing protein [Spirosoma montaniterrae]|uniref:Secretion system C-terminal sorting domain-containing protein n=1 Tax=Spirosoma montaniterrae TaxID=1178516 RepID=A0A1P9WUA8_9BACT|nr:T9SS type A sorting domain-containing protein [Spirosoma montaniterrae]AQG78965.1 hypothetical protein AWR27_06270 [Spirosoma montaniterrae]
MKNTLLLMLGLVAGTASFAQTTADKAPATSVTVTTDKRVKLIVGREQAVATVSLRDANGNVLYTQKVDLSNGLRQYFNIAELENGAYQLAVSVGNETVTNRFVIDEQPAQKIITVQS